jgi:hypothetical protein
MRETREEGRRRGRAARPGRRGWRLGTGLTGGPRPSVVVREGEGVGPRGREKGRRAG